MIEKSYLEALELIKKQIKNSKIQAVKVVNIELIRLYWNIGKVIVAKQNNSGWGKSIVEQLSKDLQQEYPNSKGFSSRNLWEMKRFYERYSKNEKLQQLVAEIPWGHNLLILNKIKDDLEAELQMFRFFFYKFSINS